MRILGLVALCFLVGCASRPSIEELEAEAVASGDWAAVEKRERLLQRRDPGTGSICPAGYVFFCYDHLFGERCECVPSQALRGYISR